MTMKLFNALEVAEMRAWAELAERSLQTLVDCLEASTISCVDKTITIVCSDYETKDELMRLLTEP